MSALSHFLHLAVPHRSNNYKARLLQPLGLFTLLLAFVIVQMGILSLSSTSSDVLGYAANISTDEVVRLTNLKRTESGLSTLNMNSSLVQAALAKGQHMLEHDYWAHIAPDGTEPWYFFSNVGYKYRYAGENLARDFSSPQAAIDAWMASPSHRDNMLSPKYTEIGIAVVEGDMSGVDTTVIVQLFGTPMAAAPVIAQQPAVAAEAQEIVPLEEVALPQKIDTTSTTVQSDPEVSPLSISKLTASITIGLLLVLLLIDVVIMQQKRLSRSGGRILAHLSFIGMVVAIIAIAKAGEIL